MTARPILFSGPMVRALLAGNKTQTRRIMKPQPSPFVQQTPDRHQTTRTEPYIDAYCGERKTAENPRGMGREWHWWTADNRLGAHVARCPYGQSGDRLWVRESIRLIDRYQVPGGCFDEPPDERADSSYVADDTPTVADAWPWKAKVLPSIHCPRGLSRITLEITGVRVERLQAISQEDARAEGCDGSGNSMGSAFADYVKLWESINGADSWNANPWVWVVSFKRLTP